MTVHYEFRDDGRIAFVRDASGKVLQDTFGGGAKPSRVETRHDAVDASGRPLAAGAGGIRSNAALRAALGEFPPRQPRRAVVNPAAGQARYDGPATAVHGLVRSCAELRARLGMSRR